MDSEKGGRENILTAAQPTNIILTKNLYMSYNNTVRLPN